MPGKKYGLIGFRIRGQTFKVYIPISLVIVFIFFPRSVIIKRIARSSKLRDEVVGYAEAGRLSKAAQPTTLLFHAMPSRAERLTLDPVYWVRPSRPFVDSSIPFVSFTAVAKS